MRSSLRTNRRTSRRHMVNIPCQIVRERDFRLVADRIFNLSSSGMLVTPAEPVVTGDRVIASFQIPDSKFWIDLDAIVTRVAHGRRQGEHARALGVEFCQMTRFSRWLIEGALRRAPVGPPITRVGRRSDALAISRLLGSQHVAA
ncbi:MAG TPA: PilZ domain-containing protein [Polyangiaceae bacterium]|nr:PilZ domain-containing protein [Polyangiaceae bacterium]